MTTDEGRMPDGSIDHEACRARSKAAGEGPIGPMQSGLHHAHQAAWPERPGIRDRLRRLGLARRYDLTLMDRRHMAIDVPAGMAPDCPRCKESCCEAPHLVSLRLADVARLADASFGWAMTRSDPARRAAVYHDHPALEAAERLDTFCRFPVLRHTGDRCVFLDEAGRCAIYPLRPLSCRGYPLRIGPGRDSVHYSEVCKPRRTDASARDSAALIDAAIDHYNAKVRDLVTLEQAGDALRRLGFEAYLP